MTSAETGSSGPAPCCTPAGMTHRLSDTAALLAPARLYGVNELRLDPNLIPAARGLYGWWFASPPAGAPVEGTREIEGWRLLYVGVAGRHDGGSRTLRKRLANHLRGPAATSTLRRTLAVLLADELGLALSRRSTGKLYLGDGETRLTAWMAEHAKVAWIEDPDPRALELALLTAGPRLPLNIEGSSDPYAATLRRQRALVGLHAT